MSNDQTDPPWYEGLDIPEDILDSIKESERTRIHSFRQAIYWVQAIEFQGNRVLETHKRPYTGIFNSPARLEEQFFLTACEKTVRLIGVLNSEGKIEEVRQFLPTEAMREFRNTMQSNHVRNKREHEENYTKPYNQKDPLFDASDPKGGVTLKVTSGITIQRGNDIIIGGRVSVRDSIAAAKGLSLHLVECQHRYERSRKKMLEAANPDDYPDIFAPDKII
ncbi:MAG: hypothetical protein COB54_08780 [Alphaproteobacteria bacterium]|nr:MAG: hypothetical protein COB54_08780 [Alphaproteobacteria bacterium]